MNLTALPAATAQQHRRPRGLLAVAAAGILITLALIAPTVGAPPPAAAAAPAGNGPLLVNGEQEPLRWLPREVAGPSGIWHLTEEYTSSAPRVLDISDDGSRIAYLYDTVIRVQAKDGSNLAVGSVPGDVQELAISPNNSTIAIRATDKNGREGIYSMPARAGSTPKLLLAETEESITGISPGLDFDPVTGKIAFIRFGRLGLLNPASGATTDFFGGCTWVNQEPTGVDCGKSDPWTWELEGAALDFSTNGDRLITVLWPKDGSATFGALARSGQVTWLLGVTDIPYDPNYGRYLSNAFFSPDGNQVALEAGSSAERDIYVQSLSGAAAIKVADSMELRGWLACPGDVCAKFEIPKATTKMQGTVSSTVFLTGDQVKLTANLTTTPRINATGTVTVLINGKKHTSKALTEASKNKVNFTLKPLAKGKHTIQMTFTKSANATDAKTGKATINVYEP
ncbi:MAG: Ig-like domain-containing protein [Leucobacter sp.]